MSIAKIIKAYESDVADYDMKEEDKLYNRFVTPDGKEIVKLVYYANGAMRTWFLTAEAAKILFNFTPATDEDENRIEDKNKYCDITMGFRNPINVLAKEENKQDCNYIYHSYLPSTKKENIFKRFLNIFFKN